MAARKQKQAVANDIVEGITLAKINKEVFEAAYHKAVSSPKSSVALPRATAPLAERVKMLVTFYRATTPAAELAGCSTCGGDSGISFEMCPFCGDHEVVNQQGEVVDPATVASSALAAAAVEPEAPEPAPAAEAPAAPPAEPDPAAVKPPGRARKARQQPAQEPPAAPPAVAEPAPAPKAGRKLKKGGSPEAAAQHTALDADAAAAMARDPDPVPVAQVVAVSPEELPAPGFTVRDLNKAVKDITKLKYDTANSLWSLGQAIKHLLDNRLWMLRTADDGSVKYRTFKQFVVGELDMSYMQAHRLSQVSESFSEEEMKKIGVSKCHVMLSVPKEKRAGLLESAASGATRAQLSTEVAAIADKERPQPPPRTEKPMTVAMAQGRVELKLFARPKGRHGYPSEGEQKASPRPAMGLNDDPFAIEVLPNDVRVLYNVAKDLDGSLVLIIERRRAKEDEIFTGDEDGEDEDDDEGSDD